MCCQSTTDGSVTQAAKSLNDSTCFAHVQSLKFTGNTLLLIRMRTAVKLVIASTHPFKIKGEIKHMFIRLRGAAAFPRFGHGIEGLWER